MGHHQTGRRRRSGLRARNFHGENTPDEWIEIAKWVRENMPKGDSWSNGYQGEVLGRLLLDLEVDALDDEAHLNICREFFPKLWERSFFLKKYN
jgi:hypothetical protein